MQRTATSRGVACLGFVALLTWDCLAREVIPPKPANYFNDYGGVVSSTTAQRLNRTLEEFEKSTSSQIVVAVFPKMQSDSSVEDYTHRVAEAWGVGQKERNNGAVLFVFVADRRMRIEVGYGLEGVLPDALAKRIVDEQIAPHFKRGDYEGGLSAGVDAILQAARGEYRGTGRTAAQRSGSRTIFFAVFWFVLLLIIFSWIIQLGRVARGTLYHRRGRQNWGGGWWGGGWGPGGGGWSSGGGSSGGGGFSGGGFSGGGGSFGGGGASGSW